jgi:hypothetical protein
MFLTKYFKTAMLGSVAVLALGGCARTNYQGLEPSARTFHEDANPRDYYVGMNLQFSVDQESPHLPAAHRLDPDVR